MGRDVILLTACVNPGSMANTFHVNCQLREKEYKEAIYFYLKKTRLPIVFCENSLCNMSKEFTSYIEIGRLEYLTFNGNHYDKARGKGVGEMEIMKYALAHSKLLQARDNIIKITGRLKILNICQLILLRNLFGKSFIQLKIKGDGTFAASQFFIAPISFLEKYFFPLEEYIDDRNYIYFEHVLGRAVKEQDKYSLLPLFLVPLISGISGTNAQPYQSDFTLYEKLQYIKQTLVENLYFNKKHAFKRLPWVNLFIVKIYLGIILFCILMFRLIGKK